MLSFSFHNLNFLFPFLLVYFFSKFLFDGVIVISAITNLDSRVLESNAFENHVERRAWRECNDRGTHLCASEPERLDPQNFDERLLTNCNINDAKRSRGFQPAQGHYPLPKSRLAKTHRTPKIHLHNEK